MDTRTKALLAMAFVAGISSSLVPAISENSLPSSSDAISRVTSHSELSPTGRAYFLLQLATLTLCADESRVDGFLRLLGSARNTGSSAQVFDGQLSRLAAEVCSPTADLFYKGRSGSAPKSKLDANKASAARAIRIALAEVDDRTDTNERMNIYFVAWRLYRLLGEAEAAAACKNILDKGIADCDEHAVMDLKILKTASIILDEEAYDALPVRVSERSRSFGQTPHAHPIYTEDAFQESEKIRLKAASPVDRLPSNDHLRRMTHRNLVLWYEDLGKPVSSQKQKEILFDLVGIHDDSILYPVSAFCGVITWWQSENVSIGGCGMG
ncbi:MAG TPA: hypothetical protein V6C81_13650 [Planktothrix sp.]|jgi:hypothetical protein